MSTYTYLAAGGEVDKNASLHDTFEGAEAIKQEYIDVFINGKWDHAFKRVENGAYKYKKL